VKDVIPEHHIQMQIYNLLVTAEVRRFSELKPKGMESNAFMYHLKMLLKQGLIVKVDGGYSLSPAGKATATRYSIREKGIRVMPSTISVIILRHMDGGWLFYSRARQPFIGAIGFASGKIHMGETLERSAYRELQEKCDYKATDTKLRYRGVFSLVDNDPVHLENHIIGHVWFGHVSEKKEFDNHAGHTFWAPVSSQFKDKLMLGTQELIDKLSADEFFALDLEFD
jgi:ADP-ribose pyrophosphatase YjhB (NUDIX family)